MSKTWTVGVARRDLPTQLRPGDLTSGLAPLVRETAAIGAELLVVPDLDGLLHQDAGAREAVQAAPLDHGVRIEAGLGAVHPHRTSRASAAARAGDGDVVLGWRRMIINAGRLGVGALHLTIGIEEDRFDPADPWADQLAATVGLLRQLTGVAADAGVLLVLKTHEEMTTFELVRLLDLVDLPNLRAGFSPVNVLARLEDPELAMSRLSGRIRTVFVDDAELVWTPSGFARRMRCLGQGSIPWAELMRALAVDADLLDVDRPDLVLDLHRAELDQPLHRDGWLSHHPDLTVGELAAVARAARPDASASHDLSERAAAAWPALAGFANRSDLHAADPLAPAGLGVGC